MEEEKESILNKSLNLVFVYVFIFLFGLVIVFSMISIINGKVEELNFEMYNNQNNIYD